MNLTYFYLSFDNSFNRYMVECEFFLNVVTTGSAVGFNRYMVECESDIWSVFLLVSTTF